MSHWCARTWSIAVLAAGAPFMMNACGDTSGTQTPDANAGGGQNDSGTAQTCTPLPGCSSTTQCPSECNTCTCIGGAWACTAKLCPDGGGAEAAPPDSGDDGGMAKTCYPLLGCSSTTQCPSECNTCTCVNGDWACTEKGCSEGGVVDAGVPGAFAADGGGYCCPPDLHPGCCMSYGGWTATSGSCGAACDGMPWPSDPAWHLVTDSHGCSMWSSQGSTGSLCGSDGGFISPPSDAAAHD
jgi:hypothetical protein